MKKTYRYILTVCLIATIGLIIAVSTKMQKEKEALVLEAIKQGNFSCLSENEYLNKAEAERIYQKIVGLFKGVSDCMECCIWDVIDSTEFYFWSDTEKLIFAGN